MKEIIGFTLLTVFLYHNAAGQEPVRTTLDLNGTWDFEQSTMAFPPRKFTRTCPVPGLIHLAEPKIEAYDRMFRKPDQVVSEDASDYRKLDYQPKYSWYRKMVFVPAELSGQNAVLTILKSQFVTQVYVNGMDLGQSMACATPVEVNATHALRFGQENELLIRVGERVWLPPMAAGGTDKEKAHYLPGIWDDVYLSFTGLQRLQRCLILPSVKEKKLEVKLLVRSFYPQQVMYGDPMEDPVTVHIEIRERSSGARVAEGTMYGTAVRDNETRLAGEIALTDFRTWSPEDPFLYEAHIRLADGEKPSDARIVRFGMRDFERVGKYFHLNGHKYYLRGTNITLHRFFEDPDCAALPWNRDWVKKMFIDHPKATGWNAMRICVGLVPDFWYDLADEHGLLLQNEWMYWQNHGWDEQIRKEYTDWLWSDGHHPSIAIWDAINENWNSFIGNELIPELRQLDPTRIWDAGYMQASDLVGEDPIDEPHLYRAGWDLFNAADPAAYLRNHPYRLGKMDDWQERHSVYLDASAAQLVNEYGWNWLWRDGRPAKLTKKAYDLLVGETASAQERRELQAYWTQCETEWIRGERSMAGVLAFTHLTNNYGYTGDWYIGSIAELHPGPSLAWLRHAFAPAAVFIDLADQRYFQNGHYLPGDRLAFTLLGVNDLQQPKTGEVRLQLIAPGGEILDEQIKQISIQPYARMSMPALLQLPDRVGGYLVVAVFRPAGEKAEVLSRRYIRIGEGVVTSWPSVDP